MDWLILAIISAALPAIPNLFDKYIIHNRRYGAKALAVVSISFYILFSLIASAPFMKGMSIELTAITLLVGFIYGIITYLIYKAFEGEQVTVVTTIYNTYPIFVALAAFVFLGEAVGGLAVAGVVLTVAGVVLVSYSSKLKFEMRKGIYLVIVCVLLAVATQLLTKFVLGKAGFWDFLPVSVIGHFLFLGWFLLEKDVRLEIRKMFGERKVIGFVAFKEMIWVVSTATFLIAMSMQKVTIVSTVSSTTPVFIFLGAFVIAKIMPGKTDEKIDAKTVFVKAISIAL